ncbi:hypothetical protein H8356DRAFT_967916 [Neocallimastix lanati (nom. inval.)]|nr:hypothetical protein H8356DRAFT_968128 [Neocallimastix sp. JGI-2020a]KAG4083534.1 hypothetical protein H8356DRAFT_967916 [Neocallimastix sp. JGI-2020a]
MNFLKFLFSFLLSINTIYCINLPSNDESNFNEEHETELTKRSRWDNDFNLKIFDDMRKDLENNPIYDDMRREMEENPIYDEMRKNIEINPIYDDMRREMENKQKKTKITSKKQSIPTILSSDKCGSKKDGIYMCKRNYCCSKYGYCGKSSAYCDSGCQSRYGKRW